jgi:hypothetical protein
MSTFYFVGNVAVASGRCCAAPAKPYYCLYETSIQSPSGASRRADLHVYSPVSDPRLPDNTVIFLIAKGYTPSNNGDILLDSIITVPYPGNPNDDTYEDNIINLPYPFVFVIGHVGAKVEPDLDRRRFFNVIVSEYIRDASKTSTVRYSFQTIN